MSPVPLPVLRQQIVACTRCPRLRAYCERVAREKKRAHRDETYWGRPVPGFGDPAARLLIVGLAPAAHGANRTGRMFTGDSSGDFLMAALHRAGFATIPTSRLAGDGLRVTDVFVAAAARCAPPDNRPTPAEFEKCRPFLVREIGALPRLAAVLALGELAWRASLAALRDAGRAIPRPLPAFSHGARAPVAGDVVLHGSYHVSRQNTNTGRLTPEMLDRVLRRIGRELG